MCVHVWCFPCDACTFAYVVCCFYDARWLARHCPAMERRLVGLGPQCLTETACWRFCWSFQPRTKIHMQRPHSTDTSVIALHFPTRVSLVEAVVDVVVGTVALLFKSRAWVPHVPLQYFDLLQPWLQRDPLF